MARRISMYGYKYPIEEVQAAATRAGTIASHINKIISGAKTNSVLIAEEVGALTGKPAALYLVQKGVEIDPIPQGCPSFPEMYEMTKEPNPDSLGLLSDLELLQLMQVVRLQASEIVAEMHKRMSCSKQD